MITNGTLCNEQISFNENEKRLLGIILGVLVIVKAVLVNWPLKNIVWFLALKPDYKQQLFE